MSLKNTCNHYKVINDVCFDNYNYYSVSDPQQLDPREATELAWLAETLPPKMKLILSCSDDSAMFKVIKTYIQSEKSFISV
jgi:hypothetical protein